MTKQYLHLSAYACDKYACDKCAGPVIAGPTAVRENEISKETDLPGSGSDLPVVRASAKPAIRAGTDPLLSTYAMGLNESDRREPWHRRNTLATYEGRVSFAHAHRQCSARSRPRSAQY